MAFKVLIIAVAACFVCAFAVEHAYYPSSQDLLHLRHLQRKSFDSNSNQLNLNQFEPNYQSGKFLDLAIRESESKNSQLELVGEEKEEPKQDESIPQYTFSYSVYDETTGDIKEQKETRIGDHVKGFYSMKEADGRHRRVEYQADDKQGFNAIVTHEGVAKIEPEPAPKKEQQEEVEEVPKSAAESSQKPVYVLSVEKPQRQYQTQEAPKLTLAEIITLLEAQDSRKVESVIQPLPQLLLSEENLEQPQPRRYNPPQSAERRAQQLARSQVRFNDGNSRYEY